MNVRWLSAFPHYGNPMDGTGEENFYARFAPPGSPPWSAEQDLLGQRLGWYDTASAAASASSAATPVSDPDVIEVRAHDTQTSPAASTPSEADIVDFNRQLMGQLGMNVRAPLSDPAFDGVEFPADDTDAVVITDLRDDPDHPGALHAARRVDAVLKGASWTGWRDTAVHVARFASSGGRGLRIGVACIVVLSAFLLVSALGPVSPGPVVPLPVEPGLHAGWTARDVGDVRNVTMTITPPTEPPSGGVPRVGGDIILTGARPDDSAIVSIQFGHTGLDVLTERSHRTWISACLTGAARACALPNQAVVVSLDREGGGWRLTVSSGGETLLREVIGGPTQVSGVTFDETAGSVSALKAWIAEIGKTLPVTAISLNGAPVDPTTLIPFGDPSAARSHLRATPPDCRGGFTVAPDADAQTMPGCQSGGAIWSTNALGIDAIE